jgi:hypothetical protein
VIEQKFLRIEDAPQHIFEGLAACARTFGGNGQQRYFHLAAVRLAHHRCQKDAPHDTFIGQRGVGQPLVEKAALGRGLPRQRLAADQVHGLHHVRL